MKEARPFLLLSPKKDVDGEDAGMEESIDIGVLYNKFKQGLKPPSPERYVCDLIGGMADLIEEVPKEYYGKLHADAFRLFYIFKKKFDISFEKCSTNKNSSIAKQELPKDKKVDKEVVDAYEELKKRINGIPENRKTGVKKGLEITAKVVNNINTNKAVNNTNTKAVYLYHIKKLFELAKRDGDISLGELVYIRDRLEKWIVDAKPIDIDKDSSDCSDEEIKDKIKKDKIENEGSLAEIFIREMVELAYEDGNCDDEELAFIRKTAEEYGYKEKDIESIVLEFDRVKYTVIERIKKGYWNKDKDILSPIRKFVDACIFPWRILWNVLSFCMVQSSVGRVTGAIAIVLFGVFVYVHTTEEKVWDAIIESTSSFFRSYGGYGGERRNIIEDRAHIYYIFQYLVLLFVVVVTFFHFGKDFANDVKRMFYTFLRTKFWRIDILNVLFKKIKTKATVVFWLVVVLVLVGFVAKLLPEHDEGNLKYVKPVYQQMGRDGIANIWVNVCISTNGTSNAFKGLDVPLIADVKTNSMEIVTNLNSLVSESDLEKCLDYFKVPPLDVTNRHIATIVVKSNAWRKICGTDVPSRKCLGRIILNRLELIPVCRSESVMSKSKERMASIICGGWVGIRNRAVRCWQDICGVPFAMRCVVIYGLIGVFVLIVRFICWFLSLWRTLELYVIWGGIDEHGVTDSCLALMADIKRTRPSAAVMIMVDRDTVPKDRYSDISEYLRPLSCCWKYVSYSRLKKYDAFGDYHFFISSKGRENRVLAQAVMDRFRNDDKDLLRVMNMKKEEEKEEKQKPKLFVRVKHSKPEDLEDWLEDPVVTENFDLRIFCKADLVTDNFWYLKKLADNERRWQEGDQNPKNEKVLFLGMDIKGCSILKSLLEKYEDKGNVECTICEKDVENRQRCLLHLLDILHDLEEKDKKKKADKKKTDKEEADILEIKELKMEKYVKESDGKKESEGEENLNSLPDVRKAIEEWSRDDYATRFSFELKERKWTFEFLGCNPTVFKAWMYDNLFKDKQFSFDYVVSCLGDAHDSLTVMRRMERVFYRKWPKDNNNRLPTNRYFMQLEDTRYASMYERKVNHEVVVFGDIRRIFTFDSIKKCAEPKDKSAKSDA